MKRLLAVLMIIGFQSSAAWAQDFDEMKRPDWFSLRSPADWLKDPGQSRSIAASAFDNNAFREPQTAGGAEVYVPKARGVLLILSWLNGNQPIKVGGVAVRNHLAQVKETQQATSGGRLGWKTQVAANVAQLGFQWTNTEDQIAGYARSFVWFTLDNKVRLVTAECRMRVDVAETLRKACLGAIAGLRLQVSVSSRAPLELAPSTGEKKRTKAKAKANADIPSPTIGAPGKGNPIIHQETPKSKSSKDHWLLIAGVGVLLIGFYLSTRSRRGEITAEPVDDGDGADDDAGDGDADGDAGAKPAAKSDTKSDKKHSDEEKDS